MDYFIYLNFPQKMYKTLNIYTKSWLMQQKERVLNQNVTKQV
jgi:hypothetical protein